MWRYPIAAICLAIGVAAGELVASLTGDETAAVPVGMLVWALGIACLWPTYFGLRDPRR
jgi:hypothetical protein